VDAKALRLYCCIQGFEFFASVSSESAEYLLAGPMAMTPFGLGGLLDRAGGAPTFRVVIWVLGDT
jgi:hypothetical protein